MTTTLECRLDRLEGADRERYQALRAAMKAAASGIRELPDGYAMQLTAEAAVFRDAAEWITLERRCCPFLALGLEWSASDAVSLTLTGGPGVKAFLAERLGR